MIANLINDKQFQELAKEYKFLNRARGDSLQGLDCIIFDLETTGLDPQYSEIIEIGAFKIKGSEIKNIFSELIKPNRPISSEITKITGIDNEMVDGCAPAESVLPRFLEFIGSDILIAHNSDFDVPFIKHHAKKLIDRTIDNPVFCTLKLSRFLLPNIANHKLHTVAGHFDLDIKNRHRSIGDCELTFQIWNKFTEMLLQKGFDTSKKIEALIAQLK
jgi:DNA polymerase-3 subunit alpha (Gram-positive type)